MAFDRLQTEVNADPDQVKEARNRRNLFRDAALDPEPDVDRTAASGSLARGSHIEPINDVDLLVVFDADEHPEWGSGPGTAESALEETRERVKSLLGSDGSVAQVVHHTRVQSHAVKCFLDDPKDPDAFTVDVVPALRHPDTGFLIPEKDNDCWIQTDPIYLIGEVLDRHEASGETFVPMLRLLKRWSKDNGALIKGLAIEVLALDHLPVDRPRPSSLSEFFTSAAASIHEPIEDPAGHCGEIQPNLDRSAAWEKLNESSDFAWRAVEAQNRGETDQAACLWRKVFGSIFPEPDQGCDDKTGGLAAAAVSGVSVGRRRVQDLGQG